MKELSVFYTLVLLFGFSGIPNYSSKAMDLPPCDDVELELEITPPFANISCDFECITLSATGSSSNVSYTISWVNVVGQSVITVCEPGTYSAIITDNLTNCTLTVSATIGEVTNTPQIDAGTGQTVSCLNKTTTLEASIGNINGDFSISWFGPNDFSSNSITPVVEDPGTYYLSVHEFLGGCTIVDSVEVTEIYEYIQTAIEGDFCPNSCYEYAGVEYCEAGVSAPIQFQTTAGCDSFVILNLEEIPLAINIEEPDKITCIQPELTLDATGSTLYDEAVLTWTTDGGNFTTNTNIPTPVIDQGGTYFLSIEWAGCTVYDTIVVEMNQEDPTVSAGEDTELDCILSLATLNGANNLDTLNKSYEWTGPDQFFATDYEVTVAQPGIYQLTIEDTTNGCKESDDVLVMEYEIFVPEFEVEPSCFNASNGSIQIMNHDLETSYKYALDEFDFQDSNNFTTLSAGSYQIAWRDDFGCGDTMEVLVPELTAIDLEMDDVYSVCGDNYITLNGAVNINTTPGPVTYLWNDGTTVPALRTNVPGNFWVEVKSACEVVRHEIEVINDLLPIEKNIYTPNAFSPNGDEVNDFFRAYVNHDIVAYQLQIFDRRGTKMFSTENPLEGWDGTIKGRKASNGVYAWRIQITVTTCGGGRDDAYLSGDVTLFR